MNKKIITAIIAMVASQNIYADNSNKFYIKLGGTGNFFTEVKYKKESSNIDMKADLAYGGSGSLGYNLSEQFSIEVGMDYLHDIIYKGYTNKKMKTKHFLERKLKIFTPKASLFYNYSFNNEMKLYFGAGAGCSIYQGEISDKFESSQKSLLKPKKLESKQSFAGTFDAGLMYDLGKAGIGLGYRFGYHGKPYGFDVMTNSVNLSLMVKF